MTLKLNMTNWESTFEVKRSLGMKMWKSLFAHIFVKTDRLSSNQDQNDNRPILHIHEYISPVKMRNFCAICLSV